jgi:hypothetical protein
MYSVLSEMGSEGLYREARYRSAELGSEHHYEGTDQLYCGALY